MGGNKFNHDELLKYPSLSSPPDRCVFVHIKYTNKLTKNKSIHCHYGTKTETFNFQTQIG